VTCNRELHGWPVNPITNPNPVCSHFNMWQYTIYVSLLSYQSLWSRIISKKVINVWCNIWSCPLLKLVSCLKLNSNLGCCFKYSGRNIMHRYMQVPCLMYILNMDLYINTHRRFLSRLLYLTCLMPFWCQEISTSPIDLTQQSRLFTWGRKQNPGSENFLKWKLEWRKIFGKLSLYMKVRIFDSDRC
jgi:hypothetical protein